MDADVCSALAPRSPAHVTPCPRVDVAAATSVINKKKSAADAYVSPFLGSSCVETEPGGIRPQSS
jgi:hypothetical protein